MFFLFQRAKIINYLQIEVNVDNLFSARKIDLPILKISHRRTSLKYLPLKTTRTTVAKILLFYSL